MCALVVFTLLHAYQGPKNMSVVFLMGGIVTLIFVLSGSIWPAIAVHIFVDILNGQTISKARQVAA